MCAWPRTTQLLGMAELWVWISVLPAEKSWRFIEALNVKFDRWSLSFLNVTFSYFKLMCSVYSSPIYM